MRGAKRILWASLVAVALSGCDDSDTFGSGSGNSSPSANDLAQGNQLANGAAGGQSRSGAGLDQTWREYQPTDLASFQAALPAYLQPYAQAYIDAGQKHNIDLLFLNDKHLRRISRKS